MNKKNIKSEESLLQEINLLKKELADLKEKESKKGKDKEKSQQAQKELEGLLSKSQEIAHIGSWSLDLVHNKLSWTDEVYRIFGLEPQEFEATYEAFLNAIHPDDREMVDTAYSSSIKEGRDSYEIEHRIIRKHSDEIRFVYEKCMHIRDDKNNIIRSVGLVQDITEQKSAKDSLKQNEEKYRSLFDQINSGVAVYEAINNGNDFIFKNFNKAGEKIDNVKRGDLIGKNVLTVFPGVMEMGLLDVFRRVWKTEKSETLPISVYKDDRVFGWRENYVYKLSSGEIVAVYEDITQKMQAKEALEQSELKFRQIADYNYDWEYWIKPNGQYVYISPSCERISGYSSEEFISKPNLFFEIVKPEFRGIVKKHFQEESEESGKSVNMVFQIITKNGEEKWIEHNCIPIFDEKGKYAGRRGNNRDITDRKHQEQALKENEERYKFLALNTSDTIWTSDLNLNVTFINDSVFNLLGYTRDEFFHLNIEKVIPPNDLKIVNEHLNHVISNTSTHPPKSILKEIKHIKKNGDIIDVEISVNIITNHDGSIIGLQGRTTDITERKKSEQKIKKANTALLESEEKYKFLANNTLDTIWTVDTNFKSTYVNNAVNELLGYTQDEFLKLNIKDYIPRKEILRLEAFGQKISHHRPADAPIDFKDEYKHIKKNGEIIDVELYGNTIKDESGNIIGFQGRTTDISKRKKAEEKIEKTTQALKKSEEKYKFLANNTLDTIWTSDINFQVNYVNNSTLELLGYTRDEFFKLNVDDYIPAKEIRKLRLLAQKRIHHLQKHESFTFKGDYKHIKKNGEIIDVEISGNTIKNSEGDVIGFQGRTSDITEKKKAEAEINKLSAAVEQSANTIVITDIEGNIEYTNPKFTELTGYTAEEALGLNPRVLNADTQPKEYYAEMWKTISKGEMWKGEFHNKKKNGELFWENVTISPLKNEKGIVTNYLAIKEDITEIKEAEEALKTSEEKLRNIFENSPNMYYSHTINHEFTYVSPQVKQILGINQDEALGLTKDEGLLKWTDLITDNPINMLGFKKTMKAINTGEPQGSYELELLHRSGRKIWVEVWEFPHLESGKVSSIIGSLSDISERKKSEQLQKLLYNISNAVITTNNLTELLETIRQELGNIIDTTNFYVAILDRETDTLNFPYYVNEKDHFTTASAKNTITKYVIETQNPLLANNKTKKELYEKGFLEYKGSLSEVWLGIPLSINEEMKGAFAIQSYNDEKAFDKSDLDMLAFISDQISVAINRKEAERKQKESEARFKRLFNDLGDAVFVTKIDEPNTGKILEVNPAAIKQTGYTRDELLQMNIMDDLSIPNSNELDKVIWEKSLQNGETVQTVDKKRRKDGSEYWTEIIITPLEFKGNKACISINHDVSDRIKAEQKLKESEERFKQLSDLSFEGILIHRNGIALDLNSTLERMFGYKIGEALGKNIIQLAIPEEYHQETAKNIMKKHAPPYEVIGRRKDGTRFPIEIESMSINIDNDDSIRVTAIRDITERIKAKEELIKAKEKAEESDRLKSAFLANMSHEIRTPMNGILGFTSLLQEPDLTAEEMKTYSAVIERSGARMLDTVNNLIDISKIEAGQMDVHITKVNINTQIDNLYQFFKVETESKNLALSFSKGLSDSRSIINTDDEKVYGALTNLIKNAVKFTREGSIDFGYKLKNGFLEFFVRDTGIGIPKNKQKSIFDRFTQADLSLSSQFEGSGLGLSITKAYAQMLGGKLWMESEESEGSMFGFSIPYDIVKTKQSPPESDDNHQIEDKNSNNITILIADDDETSSIYLQTLVQHKCEKILFAKNGKDVVEISKTNKDIDVILMDIKMPGLNGYEASQKIREFNKDVIIIAQTAYALADDREKALKAGCNDYIAKPIIKKDLMDLICKYVKL